LNPPTVRELPLGQALHGSSVGRTGKQVDASVGKGIGAEQHSPASTEPSSSFSSAASFLIAGPFTDVLLRLHEDRVLDFDGTASDTHRPHVDEDAFAGVTVAFKSV
jgi:hypothetical protein